MRTLSGWHRLFVFLAALWIVPVGYLAFSSPPSEYVDHDEVVPLLSPDSRKMLIDDGGGELAYRGSVFRILSSEFKTPGGHPLKIYKDFGKSSTLGTEYDTAYKQILARNQAKERREKLMVLLLPPVVLYVLGYAVGWVYRGFRRREPVGL
ncbi:MAG TPA: hypothetical protein VMN81_01140 [Vicinamibacterales bacterium]|nr:hypothetical protein [Vicinamibacterales bacterium]